VRLNDGNLAPTHGGISAEKFVRVICSSVHLSHLYTAGQPTRLLDCRLANTSRPITPETIP
jgi:hypothetical protein